MITRTGRPTHSGFTLVEAVLTIALMGIAAGALLQLSGLALGKQSDAIQGARMDALAEAYAAEILARRFDEQAGVGGVPACGPSAAACSLATAFDDGEARAHFDDVDDFDDLDESPPRDADGNPLADYAGFRVRVQVSYADGALVTALGLDDASDVKVVDLEISPPAGTPRQWRLYRGNF